MPPAQGTRYYGKVDGELTVLTLVHVWGGLGEELSYLCAMPSEEGMPRAFAVRPAQSSDGEYKLYCVFVVLARLNNMQRRPRRGGGERYLLWSPDLASAEDAAFVPRISDLDRAMGVQALLPMNIGHDGGGHAVPEFVLSETETAPGDNGGGVGLESPPPGPQLMGPPVEEDPSGQAPSAEDALGTIMAQLRSMQNQQAHMQSQISAIAATPPSQQDAAGGPRVQQSFLDAAMPPGSHPAQTAPPGAARAAVLQAVGQVPRSGSTPNRDAGWEMDPVGAAGPEGVSSELGRALLRALGGSGGDDALDLGGGTGTSSGARGLAAVERHRQAFESNPREVWRDFESRLVLQMNGTGTGLSGSGVRLEGYFETMTPIDGSKNEDRQTIRTVAMLCDAYRRLAAGQVDHARATIALSLAALEQSSLDGRRWDIAWNVAHMRPPSWGSYRGNRQEAGTVTRLTHPQRVYAAFAHAKDVKALAALREKEPKG